MKKALVTGSNGFIGSFLTKKLLQEGFKVRALVRKTSNLRWTKDLPIEIFYGKLTEPETLKEAVKDVDYIFHNAALKRAFTEAEYDAVNYLGTKNLIETCLRESPNIKRFIYISTLEVVGPSTKDKPVNEETPCKPITFYGSSKLKGEAEILRHSKSLPLTIIRSPAIYGPRDEDFLSLFKAIAWHIAPHPGTKQKFLSLCYIDDLIQGIWLASQKEEAKGQIYFIADENICSYHEFLEAIAKALGVRSVKIMIPDALVLMTGLINDGIAKIKSKPAILNRQKALAMIQKGWLCDTSKAKAELGFQAKISLKEGISRTVNWYRNHGWL
jgi:nucleoside-diphosphate-sugar epimerase